MKLSFLRHTSNRNLANSLEFTNLETLLIFYPSHLVSLLVKKKETASIRNTTNPLIFKVKRGSISLMNQAQPLSALYAIVSEWRPRKRHPTILRYGWTPHRIVVDSKRRRCHMFYTHAYDKNIFLLKLREQIYWHRKLQRNIY